MEKLNLKAETRSVLGKQVKKLRREGLIPANIFGKDVKSASIQVVGAEFARVFKKAGETTLIELSVGGEAAKPVFVRGIQRDPRTNSILHVDFQQVNLKEKITAQVPIVLEGEAPVAKSGEGLVLQTLSELEVEALPTEVPHQVVIDISSLTEVGQTVQVKDLKVASSATVITDPEASVLTVQVAEQEEVVEEVTEGEPEVIAEKGEAEEGAEASAEGGESEAPAEEAKE